jgi:hypothetical protein
MALPDALRLPVPRQPTPEVRAGPAYRGYAGVFIVCLTVAIALFVAPFFLATRWHWPLWALSGAVILATAPYRSWAIRWGLLSYYIHGTAVEGVVIATEPAGEHIWTLRYRYPAPDGTEVEAETVVFDSPREPLAPGTKVAVLHREDNPKDSILPTLAGLLPAG